MEISVLYHITDQAVAKKVLAGWSAGAIGAVAAVGLSIVGLTGVVPRTLAAIAAIAVGAALLVEAEVLGCWFKAMSSPVQAEGQWLESSWVGWRASWCLVAGNRRHRSH